jgi:hypothetical protein
MRLSHDTFIKSHANVRLTEALTMYFVATKTTILVPCVFDVIAIESRIFILMEFINAPLLAQEWHKLSGEERLKIMSQLRDYMLQLRNLEPPHPGRIKAVDGTGCFDIRQESKLFGPFKTVEEYHKFLGHINIRKADHWVQYSPHFEKCEGQKYKTVFSHCKITLCNILVKEGRIVGLVDWEFAGWYPEYWEYTRGYFSNLDCPGWWDLFQQITDKYDDELAVKHDLAAEFPQIGL